MRGAVELLALSLVVDLLLTVHRPVVLRGANFLSAGQKCSMLDETLPALIKCAARSKHFLNNGD
jgi:hypothetical protein